MENSNKYSDEVTRTAIRTAVGPAVMTLNLKGGLPPWGQRPWPNVLLEFETEEQATAMLQALAAASV